MAHLHPDQETRRGGYMRKTDEPINWNRHITVVVCAAIAVSAVEYAGERLFPDKPVWLICGVELLFVLALLGGYQLWHIVHRGNGSEQHTEL